MSLAAGTRIGPYEIQSALGAGGMGEVYRAHDTTLQRDVAIKILPPAFRSDPDRLTRFEREARALASLNHPNVAAIYGVEHQDGVDALVLELVDGDTLANRIRRRPLPVSEALGLAAQIADALDATHERGLIHRDLKPANIKITPGGVVKVLDFGLAKTATFGAEIGESPTAANTEAGALLGTIAYMSPEQARGLVVDKRTDIWAFGCVLFEMLSGQSPFAAATVSDTIAAIVTREPDWSRLPATTPASVRRLLGRCLQKDVRLRFRDMGDVRVAINDAMAPPDAEQATVAPGRGFGVVLATTAAIGIGLAVIALMMWDGTAARSAPVLSNLDRHFTRVTWDAAFSSEPALSPDGTLVAYASDRGGAGQLNLWLQRVSGGPPVRLTDDPADDREPDFSPDGSLIAFRADRDGGGVYVMPTLPGDARRVADGGRDPRFSPDGARIAYWTGHWLGGTREVNSAVFVVPGTGGSPTRVAASFATVRTPIWSPDGRRLLFFGRKSADTSASGGYDWWSASLETGEVVATGVYRQLGARALTLAASGIAADPLPSAWTADGVFFAARSEHSVSLWRVKISEGSGQAVDGSLERLTSGASEESMPSVDRTGRIAFQVESSFNSSWTLPIDANTGTVTGPLVRQSSDAGFPDGRNSLDDAARMLAYGKSRAGETEVWLKDLVTGKERHLVTAPALELNPVISHDGRQLAYTVRGATYVVALAGGTPKKACDGCQLQGWLADNRHLLIGVRPATGTGGRVQALDLASGQTQDVVVDPTSGVTRPTSTRDDRWVAFSARQRVWMAPLRVGAPVPPSGWVSIVPTATGSSERACGWSPDGRLLYLLLERDGFRDLYAERIDQTRGAPIGNPFVIEHMHDPTRQWGSTPFGTCIANGAFVFTQTESTGSIWLLDPPRPPAAGRTKPN